MIAHRNGVVLVQRRDGIVDVDVFNPLIGFCAIHGELHDSQKEAPDEQVLFTARHLDVVNGLRGFSRMNVTREADSPVAVVDTEIEIGVAVQEGADAGFHLQGFQPRKKTGSSIHFQHSRAVAVQIVIPGKQVFGERVEVERIPCIALLANVLKGHRKARLARTVVSVKQDEFLFSQLVAQVPGQRGKISKGFGGGHDPAPLRSLILLSSAFSSASSCSSAACASWALRRWS